MEFSCITLVDPITEGYLSLPPTEIVPEPGRYFFDYEQKYMPGRATKYTPARCSHDVIKKIQATCIRVMEIMEFKTMSRIDGFVTSDEKIVIVDPNSLSGMDPASFLFVQGAAINMNHTQIINYLIETELHNNQIVSPLSDQQETVVNLSKKVRVAVLMGGQSNEKEISLASGRNHGTVPFTSVTACA
jgi:D-alanine-D-alanine ligase